MLRKHLCTLANAQDRNIRAQTRIDPIVFPANKRMLLRFTGVVHATIDDGPCHFICDVRIKRITCERLPGINLIALLRQPTDDAVIRRLMAVTHQNDTLPHIVPLDELELRGP